MSESPFSRGWKKRPQQGALWKKPAEAPPRPEPAAAELSFGLAHFAEDGGAPGVWHGKWPCGCAVELHADGWQHFWKGCKEGHGGMKR